MIIFCMLPASAYDLRVCSSADQARANFTNCTQITQEQVSDANLTQPLPAYTVENLTWHIPHDFNHTVVFFALQVQDDQGSESPVSNIAVTVLSHGYDEPVMPNTLQDSRLKGIYFAGPVIVLAVITIAGLALFVRRKHNAKRAYKVDVAV